MALMSEPLGEPFCQQVEQVCIMQPQLVHTVLYRSAI